MSNAAPTAWNHRIFLCRPRGAGWRCVNRAPGLCPVYPLEFQWATRTDDEGLKRYIDLVLTERTSEVRSIEATGVVTDIVMDTSPEAPATYISPQALLNLLLLRDPARIPLHQGLRLYRAHTNKGKPVIFPGDIPLALSRLYGSMEDKNPILLDKGFMAKHGLARTDIHTGLYLDRPDLAPRIADDDLRELHERAGGATASLVGGPSAAPAVPPRETLLQHEATGQAVIALSRVAPADGSPDYYVRRVVAIDSGALAYVATSYRRNGPWHVWERDNSLLLRLRVNPD